LLDLRSLFRRAWLIAVAISLAIVFVLAAARIFDQEPEARFRVNVVVEALPPLFGPPVVPGPFDYATLATSEAVIAETARRTATTADDLRPRLRAEPRVNSPELDLTVSGPNALAVARAWQQVLSEAAIRETPAMERELVATYDDQLAQARAKLESAAAAAAAAPESPIVGVELAAAEENYETAARLVQSYEVVAETMTARAFTVRAPHSYGGGLASRPAQIAAGAAIGLTAGVVAALALEYGSRRRVSAENRGVPPSLRSIEQRAGSSR
jgi:hypothetical protein